MKLRVNKEPMFVNKCCAREISELKHLCDMVIK